jgi:hypothetical protein
MAAPSSSPINNSESILYIVFASLIAFAGVLGFMVCISQINKIKDVYYNFTNL